MASGEAVQPADQITEISDHELDSNSCPVEDQATRIYQSKMARKTAKANMSREK